MSTIYQVTLFQSFQGQIIENVLHFSGEGTADALEMSHLADDVNVNWITPVLTQQVTALKYFQIKVEMMNGGFAPVVKAISRDGTNGGNDNDKATYAHVLRKRTAFPGRHGRGRAFIGGIANNADQKSFLDQQRITNWTARCIEIMNAYKDGGTSDFTIGIVARANPLNSFKPLIALEIAPQYANVQTRKVGRGI